MTTTASLAAFLAITKALADESRVRILLALDGRELCVCQIVDLLGLAPSTTSKHLSILRQSGLIAGRKDGRWAWYRLAGAQATPLAAHAIDWALASAGVTRQAAADRTRLAKIQSCDPEALCQRIHPR